MGSERDTKNKDHHPAKKISEIVRFRLKSHAKQAAPVFIAGSFNHWDPGNPAYMMKRIGPDLFEFELKPEDGHNFPFEYLYTRGDWDTVEVGVFGGKKNARGVEEPAFLLEDIVYRWKENGIYYQPRFLPRIEVISKDFEIPELKRTRRIAALLPHNYDHSDRRYPVIYLQDGQNLMDDDAPFGNWEVDKKLAVLAEFGLSDVIVIAIDHGGKERIKEYQPYKQKPWGEVEGTDYIHFLVNTLKPQVDKKFRTLPGREHTGIGGSSMGGLISLYAGLVHSEVFSRILVFSPSLWIAPKLFQEIPNFRKDLVSWVYLYGGGSESKKMVPDIRRLESLLLHASGMGHRLSVHVSIKEKGVHNERDWGLEFPWAVKWLFYPEHPLKRPD